VKIGVISDTHIRDSTHKLPGALLDAFKDCELILHAGDLVDLSVIDQLIKVTKVEAVRGNMDLPKTQAALQDKKILDLCGKKICLMHGYGNPKNLINVLKKSLSKYKPNVIVFGHSHVPMNEYVDGVLFFNPGSATDTIFSTYRSYGIIEMTKGKIKADIYRL